MLVKNTPEYLNSEGVEQGARLRANRARDGQLVALSRPTGRSRPAATASAEGRLIPHPTEESQKRYQSRVAGQDMTYSAMQILVVDDNAVDRQLLGLVLEGRLPGIRLVEADSATALAEHLARNRFDAAVIEQRLQWADGRDVLRILRRLLPDCPVILFSTADDPLVNLVPQEDADGYIHKDGAGYLRVANALHRHLSRRAATGGSHPQPPVAEASGHLRGEGAQPTSQPLTASPATGPLQGAGDAPPPAQAGVVRLLHLTDTHLYADPHGKLLGQSTRKTFELVLDRALQRFWPVDRVLLTGDLVHDESREGYRYLRQRLAQLDTPCSSLPGNHDAFRVLVSIFNDGPVSFAPSARCGSWSLVFLDSTVPGSDGGHLDAAQLEQLEETLRAERGAHTLVCLHHQPVPVGSAWLDTMALDNPKPFFAIIDRHPQVRGVLWGHVHQEYQGLRNDVLMLATPSTCVQFLPGSEKFAIDPRTPGFRWLELHPDGRIHTGVERIDHYPDPIDLTTNGY